MLRVVVLSTRSKYFCALRLPLDHMPDAPLPELIGILRVGSVISGECSVCHEVVMVKGIAVETPEELLDMLKRAFVEHVCNKRSRQFARHLGASGTPWGTPCI